MTPPVRLPPIRLPIDPLLPQALEAVRQHGTLVLKASPGSGKTTRLPPALLDAPERPADQEVWVLEPRRLAAKYSARRVAEERGELLGQSVGYQFRLEQVGGPRTRLRFLTEGMLLRKLMGNPTLQGVWAVVLDEFHERHLHTDLALGFLTWLKRGKRPDLKLVVMSATLDTDALARHLGTAAKPAPVLELQAPRFNVELRYAPQAAHLPLDRVVATEVRKCFAEFKDGKTPRGDVLVFLPGRYEIQKCATALASAERSPGLGAEVCPLYGDLSREEQDRALAPGSDPKVILATNVAETSLTVPGVTVVIDSGLHRRASYAHGSGVPALKTRPISKASAIQRAGRAGRTQDGVCIRLYSKGDFDGRAPFEVPEIRRADLAQSALELLALGVRDLKRFPWFEAPEAGPLDSTLLLLHRLGAATREPAITPLGEELARIPAHPRVARALLSARDQGPAGWEAVLNWAALTMEDPDALPSELSAEDLLKLRVGGATQRARSQLESALGRAPTGAPGRARGGLIEDALIHGFPDRVARVSGRQAEFAFGGAAELPEADALRLRDSWILVLEVRATQHAGDLRERTRASRWCRILPESLLSIEPEGPTEVTAFSWDGARAWATEKLAYGRLALTESRAPAAPGPDCARFVLAELLGQGWEQRPEAELVGLLQQRGLVRAEGFEALTAQVGRMAAYQSGPLGLPAALRAGAASCTSLRELQEIDWPEALLAGWIETHGLTRDAFERQVPTHVTLARGRRVPVNYPVGQPAWIESRMQDFFGLAQGPAILGGRAPLVLHLLAPNRRAVQVTTDLPGFWKKHYPALRTQLMRRYPRHAWPENPLDLLPDGSL